MKSGIRTPVESTGLAKPEIAAGRDFCEWLRAGDREVTRLKASINPLTVYWRTKSSYKVFP
jgi:hypothetical protein